MQKQKLWQKQKKLQLNSFILEFNSKEDSIIDNKLIKFDALATVAHAKMLQKIEILAEKEFNEIKEELKKVLSLISEKKFTVSLEEEDMHTKIENHLTKALGDTGKKIQFARSRNEQIAAAVKLYSKQQIIETQDIALQLCKTLLEFAEKNKQIALPGYTHMQKAMPSSIELWSAAFIESLLFDIDLLQNAFALNNKSPLGTVAGYGCSIDTKKEFTAELLGFNEICLSPLFAQNSRGKTEHATTEALLQIMLSLNKLATDLLLFSMQEFNFFSLNGKLCTGSSVMPHKKNVDVLELVRAKTSVVKAENEKIASIISNLPSGYNRDFQEIKPPLINCFETTKNCLKAMKIVIENITVENANIEKALTPELFTAEQAFTIAKQGIPFREAYKQTTNKITETDFVPTIDFVYFKEQIKTKQKTIYSCFEEFDKKIQELIQ